MDINRVNSNAVHEMARANKRLEKRIEELEKRLIASSRPSLTDTEDSIQCGGCSSDIPIDEDYQFCHYCGQKL